MHPETRDVADHMRKFGLAILGRAVYDYTFSDLMAPYKHDMAIGLAAQGAEICIKARVAQEHPLLIFTQLPKSASAEDRLTVAELFEYGRTVQYFELPELLWATTGVRMAKVDHYQRLGKLRNLLMHFGPADVVPTGHEPMSFLFEVMEPLVQAFWGESIIPYAAKWDDVLLDTHLEDMLQQCKVEITPALRAALDKAGSSPP
ncbi:MAG: hypothetical protein AB7U83_12570 [Vicinamibacterales bacterium]